MKAIGRSSSGYAWLVVGLLWGVAMLNHLDRLTITTMRDSIKADIAMTDAQFGLLTSVFLWVYALLSPTAGYLADRFSRSGVIVASLFAWSLITWLTGQCHTVGQLLTARALMGISEACYIPAALALIADYHHGGTRFRATGIHMSGIYAGAALGGVGGYVAEGFGWRMGFTLFGIVGIVYAFVLLFLLRDPERPAISDDSPPVAPVTPGYALRSLFRQPSYYVILLHWTLLSIAGWGISGWLPTYLREHFHMGQGAAGISATAYIQAAAFAGIFIGGFWADFWSRSNVRGRVLVVMIGLLIAGPALFMATSTSLFLIAIIGLILYGLSRGLSDCNMMPILCQVADPRCRATGYGIMNFCSCMAGGVMIYVGGLLRDRQAELGASMQAELGRIFQYSAVGMFIAGALLILIWPRREVENA